MNHCSTQVIREYTGKVDELIKDKIEAQKEVKAKEKEEKDMVAQQVFTYLFTLKSGNFIIKLADSVMIEIHLFLQNMYAQLLPLALPAPPMPGMGGVGGGFVPPPPAAMGGMGMPPMPPFGMPPMGSY